MSQSSRHDLLNKAASETDTLDAVRAKKPSLYRVLLVNDDYTPMEFVTWVLQRVFRKNYEEAQRIMLMVHRHGLGICGVYSYEIASTRVRMVLELAREHQHPLLCRLERD